MWTFKIQYGQIYRSTTYQKAAIFLYFKIQYGQIYSGKTNTFYIFGGILKSNMDRFIDWEKKYHELDESF